MLLVVPLSGVVLQTAPYCANKEGKGPAWANSLFRDNAEFGYSMLMATKKIRNKLALLMEEALSLDISPELKEAFKELVSGKDDAKAKEATLKILPLLAQEDNEVVKEIDANKDFLIKRSQWIFGGDGLAYDIGYGGLDHVLASGEDV